MEAFTDGQPSLLLRVRRESEPGSVDVPACRAKWKHSRPEPQLDAGDLVGVRAIEPEILAREAEAERAARTKPLVVPLGPSADVQLQSSRTLEAMAQQPGSEADSTRVPGDQKHRNMGLNEPIGLDLERTDEMPTGDRNQRRHAGRGQCTAGPLDMSAYSVQPSAATSAISPSRWASVNGSIEISVMRHRRLGSWRNLGIARQRLK